MRRHARGEERVRSARLLLPLRALGVLFAAGLVQLTWAPPVEAGVVVLKNGEVIIGRVRDEEDTQEELVVRWPYKERTDRGVMKIPKFRIRWYDRKEDQLTDEYWEKYEDIATYPIDNLYMSSLERWRLRKEEDAGQLGDLLIVPESLMNRGLKLSPIPYENELYKVQKPENWSSSVEDGITVFISDKAGAQGFRPRIHVFSVPSVLGSVEDQVEWIEREAARLAEGGAQFEVREKKRPRPRSGGFDQELLTRTVRVERPIVTLRTIFFRDKSTYFFTAYAHENDFGAHELIFKMCMRSMEIFEDKAKAPGGKPVEVSDGSAPEGAPGEGN